MSSTSVVSEPGPAGHVAAPSAAAPWAARSRRVLPALIPGLLMAVIGLIGSSRPVLSWDEIATADVAQRPVGQIGRLAQHIDGVFSPYYLFMHLWTAIAGDAVLALRLPSIVAMALAVAVAAELGRHLFGPLVGTVAGLLLCLLPNLSRYAAEARPYAMACLFATLALLLLYRAAERPTRLRWAGYGAAVLALGLSHILGLITLAAHLVILALRRERGPLAAWTATVAAAVLLLSPLLWWGLRQRGDQLDWVPPVTAGAVYTFPARLVGSAATAWILIGLILVAAGLKRRAVAEMLIAAAVPLALLCVVSMVGPSFWVVRYVLFVLMPVAVVAAAGIVHAGAGLRYRTAALRLLLVLAVVAASAVPGQRAVRQPTVKNGGDYRALAGLIRDRQAAGDVIVYGPGRTMRPGVGYYLRSDDGAPPDILQAESAGRAGALTAREFPDPVPHLAGADRIWLVVFGHRADPATARPDLAPLLRSQYRLAESWQVKGATMALYVARG